MAGFVPAIHVLAGHKQERRGCPAQGRAWRAWLHRLISLAALRV